MSSGPDFHSWTHRPKRLGGTDQMPPAGHYEIKLFADRGALDGNLPESAIVVSDGDGKFWLVIPPGLNRTSLTLAEAGISVASGSDLTVEVINVGPDPGAPSPVNMLDTVITIAAGDYVSFTPGSSDGATLIAADPDNLVLSGDWVQFNVASGGADTAEGLAVIVEFNL